MLQLITGMAKAAKAKKYKRFINKLTRPIDFYYNTIQMVDKKLFGGKAWLIRWVDVFWVCLILYLLWYRFFH